MAVQVAWESWLAVKVPYDADFVAALKRHVPVRAFDGGTKNWFVPERYADIVRKLARQYLDLDLRLPELESAPVVRVAPVVPPDYDVLCVLPGSPIEVVKAAYKALAFMCHPDRGGNAEHFRQLTAAYERVTGTGARTR